MKAVAKDEGKGAKGKGKGKEAGGAGGAKAPNVAVSAVLNDPELVVNVVSTLAGNALNTKMLFAGLRLLSEWILLDDRLQRKIFEAGAASVAISTWDNLRLANLTQMASWLEVIAHDLMHPPEDLKDVRPPSQKSSQQATPSRAKSPAGGAKKPEGKGNKPLAAQRSSNMKG